MFQIMMGNPAMGYEDVLSMDREERGWWVDRLTKHFKELNKE